MSEQIRGLAYDPYGIGGVLSNWRLRVPPNQRDYMWGKDEVDDLFLDLSRSIGPGGSPQYFLGTIVTIPQGGDLLEVVDGQQRLATITILLAAIRDYLAARKPDALIVESLNNQFLSAIDRDANERTPRLRMNESDRIYFDARIYDSNTEATRTSPSHDRINEAAEIARSHVLKLVAPYDTKEHGRVLNEWIKYVERSALVILLRVQNGANAYKMFETLNDRGLRTSQADLVKNLLFGNSSDRLSEAQAKWAGMRAVLEQIDEEDILITFLRHVLMVIRGFLRESEVYDRVQERAISSTGALQLLADFERGAQDYVAIMVADHDKWSGYPPRARQAIHVLSRLRAKALRPLMLAIARTFTEKEAAIAFRLLVDVWVRWMVVGGSRSGHTETTIAQTSLKISERRITSARELRAALADLVPDDRMFTEAFKLHSVSNRIHARYYLRSLERSARNEKEPCFIPNEDETAISLEHVLPQRSMGNYPLFDADAAKALCNRLGTLALLQVTPNSDQKSAPFDEKRRAYRDCDFVLTRQLADLEGDWSPKAIVARQNRLAELAVKTWPFRV